MTVPQMTKQQVAFAQAYARCEERLALYSKASPEAGELLDQETLICYWYAGQDPDADPDRHHIPPPPPPPPPPF